MGGVEKADELKQKVADAKAGSYDEEALKKLKKCASDKEYYWNQGGREKIQKKLTTKTAVKRQRANKHCEEIIKR